MCDHPERPRLEMQRAAGVPLSTLAKHYKLGRSAIHRHWQNHVSDKAKATYLAGPSELAELHARAAAEGASVLDYLKIVRNSLSSAMADASALGDPRAVAQVGTALVGCLEKLGKITGEVANLSGGNTFNIAFMQSPEWASLQADIITALAPHPAALADVVAMLRRRDDEAAARALPAPARDVTPAVRQPVTIDHLPPPPLPKVAA
ncbi:MAG: hypothetical protein K9G60_01835 [Pseudolabrys sp.]|nr:hypothetical protein [Pseudolabrys sp.]